MVVPPQNASVCRFGVFELDLRAAELRKNGVKLRLQDQPYQVLLKLLEHHGEIVSRDIGYAILRVNGFETVDEIVFAQEGDLNLLGSRTLEGFGAIVDARRKMLVAAGPHLAAICSGSR